MADFFSKTLQKNLFNINLKRLGMVGSFRDEVELRALKAYDHSDWVNAPGPSAAESWRLYHVFHGQIDFGGAETAYYSSETKANIAVSLVGTARYRGYLRYLRYPTVPTVPTVLRREALSIIPRISCLKPPINRQSDELS